MSLNNGPADRKAHSHSVLLRSEESLEDLLVVCDSYSLVHNLGENDILLSLTTDYQLFRINDDILHRIDCVRDQIKEYLLQLDPVGCDLRKVLRNLQID